MSRNTDDVLLGKEEYNELRDDSHSLELIFNFIEVKSYIDLDGNFCIPEAEVMNILQTINPDRLSDIEKEKRQGYEEFKEKAEGIVEQIEKENPQQSEQQAEDEIEEEF